MPGGVPDRVLTGLTFLAALALPAYFAVPALLDRDSAVSEPVGLDEARLELHVKGGGAQTPPSDMKGPSAYDAAGHAAEGPGGLAFLVSALTLRFGDLEPGERSGPIPLTVHNVGKRPFELRATATDLHGPHGAAIPANHLQVTSSPALTPVALGAVPAAAPGGVIAPGATVTLVLFLTVPSGDEAYIPAGPYAGTLTLVAVAVQQ